MSSSILSPFGYFQAPQKAVVLRDGQKIELSADELVVGDIVFVKIGDKTPAGS